MAKGRPRDPKRDVSHSSGHRAPTGKSAPLALAPVATPLAAVPAPDGLGPVAADIWCTVLSDMAALRTLREVDLPLVRAYCEAAQVHADASAIVSAKGVLVAGPMGGPIANPMIKVAKDAAVSMRQLSDVLGLNPLARIRGNLMEAAAGAVVLDIQRKLKELMGE